MLACTFLLLLLCAALRIGDAYVGPGPFVAYADDDLAYGSLHADADEWAAVVDAAQPQQRGHIHMWLRCAESTFRAFFWVEQAVYDAAHSISKAVRPTNLTFTLDGHRVTDVVLPSTWGDPSAGAMFTYKAHKLLVKVPPYATVVVGVVGFRHTFDVPLSLCSAPPPPNPLNGRRSLVMSTFTKDHPTSFERPFISYRAAVVKMLERHIRHAECLGFDSYEVFMHAGFARNLMAHPHINASVVRGFVKLLAAPPYLENLEGAMPEWWQSVSMNLALLRHWKRNAFVLLIDPDELFSFTTPADIGILREVSNLDPSVSTGVVQFPRRNAAFAFDVDVPSFTPDSLVPWDAPGRVLTLWEEPEMQPKAGVNADVGFGATNHWTTGCAGCKEPQLFLNTSRVVLVHFSNAYMRRTKPSDFTKPNARAFGPTGGPALAAVACPKA